ncbi:hypothetical protein [Georgenia sp. AZ-5]|uniref:hypothetical protein n=1 Tax=Georgenia sp. AZ-5 TaxID=3367526 RepID=UPI003754A729
MSHMLVRSGKQPLGIQVSLDLDGLCSVVDQVFILLADLSAKAAQLIGHASVIASALDRVELLLAAIAESRGTTTVQCVRDYWLELAARDAQN